MLWKTVKAARAGTRLHNDKLTLLMEAYPKVPLWWNAVLFLIPAAVIIALAATGVLYLPLYTVFIAIGFGALIVSRPRHTFLLALIVFLGSTHGVRLRRLGLPSPCRV